MALVTLLLLGGVVSAQADHDVYTNTTKHARSDDVLQADTGYCTQLLGAPQNGVPTPRVYKSCMLGRGWRFSHTVHERGARDGLYPDPDDSGRCSRVSRSAASPDRTVRMSGRKVESLS